MNYFPNFGHGAASTSGNTNEGSFASPTVSATASGKPLRRSKPRLVKLRKSVPQQAGSTPVTETEASSSFNRFREVPTSLDQNEMQDLRDKWQGWNPFSPGSAQKTGGSNAFGASSSSAHKVGKSNDADFVFGSNRSSLDSNSNVGKSGISESVGESIRQEMSKLNFGNQSEKKASKDFTFNFRAGSGESSIPGMFVSGNNPKKGNDFDGNGASKQQDQSGNSNNEGFQNQNNAEEPVNANFTSKGSGKNSFVFGRSDTVESLASEIPESMGKLNLKDSGDLGGSEKSKDAGPDLKSNNNTFVFGSGNSTGVHSESSSRLPDELKKLNIGGSSSDDVIRKTNETNVKASSNNVFVFASNKKPASDGAASVLHNDMQKLNIGDRLGAHTDQMNTAFSSRTSAKEAQCDPDVENPISAPSNFQSGVQGKNSVEGQAPLYQPNVENATGLDGASSSTFSSTSYHSVGNVFEMPLKDRTESKGDFSFTSTTDESGAPFPDFRTPKQDSAFASAGIFFSDLNKKLEFSAKSGATKDCKLKKRKGKRRSAMRNCGDGQAFVSRGSSSQENLESPGSYSPMDFSPYEKPLAGDQDSRETSMASDESFHLDNGFVSTNAQYSVTAEATAEPLAAEAQHLHINDDDLKCREMNGGCLKKGFDKNVGVGDPVDDSLCGTETAYFRSKMEKANMDSDASGATETTETSFSSNLEKQETDSRVPFAFASTSEDTGKTNLTFSASSSSTRGQSSATVSRHRKKNRLRVVQESYNSTLNAKFQMASSSLQFTPFPSNSSLSGAGQSKRGDSSTSESRGDIRSETEKEPGVKQGSFSTVAVPTAAQECEKWRLRGNQAYANGQSSIAEDYYTRGVNCISPNETSTNCLEALMLCYSNRAATRMALGRVREALEDCQTATAIDPNFLKVQLRAANCHLALGEIEEATKCFSICFRSAADVCLDRKLVIEASNGLQKAQQVGQHIDRSIEFLRQRKQSDAEKVLQIVAEGLSISPFSEKLIEMKAEALFMLRKYEEVIQLCELTLESAERNSIAVTSDCQLVKMDSSKSNKDSAERLWRVYLISKSYFYLGKLDEALDLLEKHTNLRTAVKKNRSKTLESLMTLAATLHELLQHKAAGNEAFQSGRYSEAVERYTAALSCNVESRPFAAICICNRGAAYQMLGQITDAIADCSLAIALDGNYLKAISRRATLHERIRDYGQAVNDLERYISLLEKQSEGKTGATGKSASRVNNLREAHQRLSSMEEKAKKGIPLDMYLILGVESTGTASDIKKAYRKSALRHHPDKAGQFLARIENGDDGLWKEIAEEIHKDADRLFKMIGEAYAVLSDPSKRSQYDLEEKIRNSHKKGGGNSERTPDVHDYPFDRSASRRQWRYAWKSYGNQQYHWS